MRFLILFLSLFFASQSWADPTPVPSPLVSDTNNSYTPVSYTSSLKFVPYVRTNTGNWVRQAGTNDGHANVVVDNGCLETGGNLEAVENHALSIDNKIVTTVNGIKVDIGTGGTAVTLTVSASVAQGSGNTYSAWATYSTITANVNATQLGTWNLNNVSGTISLPTGASTASNQTTANTSLGTIATNTTGVSTSSLQTTGNNSLAVIAANTIGLMTHADASGLTIAASPLPTGASTEATLAAIKAKTDNLDVLLSTRTKPSDTQGISAASLPLPSNAASETGGNLAAIKTDVDKIPSLGQALSAASVPVVLPATQITALTPPAAITGFALEAGHLATIDTSTARIPAQGQALSGASMPVVLPAAQITTLTPPAAITGFALEAGHLATIDTKVPSLGQAVASASVPVVLPSAQITTLTPPAAISGFALEAGHLAAIDTNAAKIPAQGQALAGASMPVVLPAAQITTLTPPAAITGFALESGHLSTIDTKTPSLGQALAAASVPVVLTAAQITTLTPPAAITGFALESGGHLATIDTSTAKIPAQGQALAAASMPVVLPATQITTLTPPAAITGFALEAGHLATIDTSTSGMNAKFGSLGQKAMSGSAPVVIASDQASIPVADTPPTLTKGTQAATGFSVQELKDAGRNETDYFMAAGVAGTSSEVMQSLTGYKGGVAVTASVTPVVVTSGKTYRITSIVLSYQSLSTAGGVTFRLRANLSGVGAVGSPLVNNYTIGSVGAVAGVTTTLEIPFPDGKEFPAGTGIAVGMIGINTVGGAAASGFGTISINGYEY